MLQTSRRTFHEKPTGEIFRSAASVRTAAPEESQFTSFNGSAMVYHHAVPARQGQCNRLGLKSMGPPIFPATPHSMGILPISRHSLVVRASCLPVARSRRNASATPNAASDPNTQFGLAFTRLAVGHPARRPPNANPNGTFFQVIFHQLRDSALIFNRRRRGDGIWHGVHRQVQLAVQNSSASEKCQMQDARCPTPYFSKINLLFHKAPHNKRH